MFLLWLGNLIFYKGLLAGQEVSRKRKHLSTEKISAKADKVSTPVATLFWKEWKLFMRTPVYAMNGLAGMVMVPFLMFMPFITRGEEMKEILLYTRQPEYLMLTTLGGAAVALFTSSINIVACTSISREGRTFWISKIIPAPAKQQVTAKLLHSMAISCLGILVTVTALGMVFKLSLLRLLVIFVLCLLGNLLLNALNLLIDLLRPKLKWNDPQEAVKQNLNGLFSILFTFAALAVFAVLTVLLVKTGISEWLIYAILGLVMGLLAIPSAASLYAMAGAQYKKIEI